MSGRRSSATPEIAEWRRQLALIVQAGDERSEGAAKAIELTELKLELGAALTKLGELAFTGTGNACFPGVMAAIRAGLNLFEASGEQVEEVEEAA